MQISIIIIEKNLMWFPHFLFLGQKRMNFQKSNKNKNHYNNNYNKSLYLFANNSQVLKIFACAIYKIRYKFGISM